jgi:hypothetical protein
VSTAKTIADALSVLNLAISAASNIEKTRIVIADAVAAGRDVSDAELAAAEAELDASIDAARKA